MTLAALRSGLAGTLRDQADAVRDLSSGLADDDACVGSSSRPRLLRCAVMTSGNRRK